MNGWIDMWKCQKERISEWQVLMTSTLAGYQDPGTSTYSFSGHPDQKNKGQPEQGAVHTQARAENRLFKTLR